MNGCLSIIGVLVLILAALAGLNFIVWAAVTFFPYAILAIIVVSAIVLGALGSRY